MAASLERGNLDVAIVGAGPSGLAMAIELGSRGIRCVVIERRDRAPANPRAKTTHTRTREHLRRWGIAGKLAAASPFGIDYPTDVMFVTRLAGPQITKFENAFNAAPAHDERYSEHAQWIPQYKLEATLRSHAESLESVEIRPNTEFMSFDQDEGGVRVRTRDLASGREAELDCKYLVGADGARSAVRKQIGAEMVGVEGLSFNYNVIIRAPGLAEAHDHGAGIFYWQMNPDVPSIIGPMDQGDLWFFSPTMVSPDSDYSEDEIKDLLVRATGIDLPYEIVSSDKWVVSRLLADRYRQGRAFVIGDACHINPPFGGFGMNMGIADAVDLGWKMTAVIRGWGGPTLLDSYEAERRVLHDFVLEESELNHSVLPNQLIREHADEDSARGERTRAEIAEAIQSSKRDEFHTLGVVLGYCYHGSPIIVEKEGEAAWVGSREYAPSARPGCVAPHKWIDDDISLYDLFGEGFTLLALHGARPEDLRAADEAAGRGGIPLTLVELDDPALAELYEAKLVLIRPDQHVAWRGEVWPGDSVLRVITGGAI
jgi:2-polyprenyl-6-methoxyphenol hydroxylase-like FAD-dependent oxidoreductase